MLFPTNDIALLHLHETYFTEKRVGVAVLRLDMIHPVVSGNKLFKLNYFLKEASQNKYEGILTFGGAYSNHLVATAYACKTVGLKSIGIVRGEAPENYSHTLIDCEHYGMQLHFISRKDYGLIDDSAYLEALQKKHPTYLFIPEGGYHPLGANGAADIMSLIDNETTHVCCAIGTATTFSGLLAGLKKNQQLIGVPVLKGLIDIKERINYLLADHSSNYYIADHYHFGGYAKKNDSLIMFMNDFYRKHQVPTDFIYTAKMMFGISDMIKQNYFNPGDKIVCIHTGGLQGNQSLPAGALVF